MRILVTGGAGFIGSTLAQRLLEDNHDVVIVDDLSTGVRGNVPAGAEFVLGDIRDGLQIPMGQWETIFHCAASYADRTDWKRDVTTNTLGTINVLDAALMTGAKLVYFQTSLTYGPNPKSPVPTDAPLDPHGSYAVSKTAGEQYIRDSGIQFVSLRLANVYGPRNLSGPVPTFYKRLTEGLPCTVVDSRRDFIYVDDLVGLAVKAATQGQGVYHASTGTDISIRELFMAVGQAMRLDVPMPDVIPRGPDDVATLLLDPEDTLEEFGWSARTPLVAGIRQAVDWYREHPVTRTFTHLSMKG